MEYEHPQVRRLLGVHSVRFPARIYPLLWELHAIWEWGGELRCPWETNASRTKSSFKGSYLPSDSQCWRALLIVWQVVGLAELS